jgi:hypothetical protein
MHLREQLIEKILLFPPTSWRPAADAPEPGSRRRQLLARPRNYSHPGQAVNSRQPEDEFGNRLKMNSTIVILISILSLIAIASSHVPLHNIHHVK